MASLSVSVTRKTLKELDELKKEIREKLKEEYGFEDVSYNKVILYLIKTYRKMMKGNVE
ncbi:MAG: hypothetical protein H0Z19_08455 [Archaeoglobus sp.]|nr:hypothetical protein [Archaeoglobus sp.]